MAQKVQWNIAKKRTLGDRGATPKEEGISVREYKPYTRRTFSVVD